MLLPLLLLICYFFFCKLYSVVDPDGVLRIVKYTADKHNGFQAEVITSGKGHGGDGGGHGGDSGGGHAGHYESAPAHLESSVEHDDDDDHEEYNY